MGRIIAYDQPLPSLVYVTNSNQDTSVGTVTVVTYSSVAIGAESPTRKIILPVGYVSVGALNSVTINGVSATQHVAAVDGLVSRAEIWSASVPTGTSVTVVLTFASDTNYSAIGVYAAYDLASATPTATNSDIDPVDVSLNVQADGFAVACAFVNTGGSSGSATWTGVTEDFDVGFNADKNRLSAGQFKTTSDVSPRTISVSGLSGSVGGVAAAFR